jgi:hypothetical protein
MFSNLKVPPGWIFYSITVYVGEPVAILKIKAVASLLPEE